MGWDTPMGGGRGRYRSQQCSLCLVAHPRPIGVPVLSPPGGPPFNPSGADLKGLPDPVGAEMQA
jgi:hypothetical protein